MLLKFIDFMIGVLTPGFFMSGGGGSTIPQIGHSLRFRAASSTYLSKTLSGSGSRTTSTLSVRAKRGSLGADRAIFSGSSSQRGLLYFDANDRLTFDVFGSTAYVRFAPQYRDPAAFLDITFIIDTNNATGTDRIRCYVNGERLSTTSYTTPALGATPEWNNGVSHSIGRDATGASRYFDGQIARVCFVDGQALDPSNFSYTDPATNQWCSRSQSALKALADAGGANSFMLDFDDGTSLTTLGYDKSSKGNHWTLNNVSLTAGATYDWMEDTPTNNFATLNPLDVSSATLSEGNLKAVLSATTAANARGTIAVSSGKWYWEVKYESGSTQSLMVGVADAAFTAASTTYQSANGWFYYLSNGFKYTANGSSAYGAAVAYGDVVGVALDMDAGTVTFYKNGVSQGVAYSGLGGRSITPAHNNGTTGGTQTVTLNFGQRPFAYTPPAGFKLLCTKNLPTPSIKLPKKHFDVITHAGNSATSRAITGVAFPPDFAWIKNRSGGNNHVLFDTIRGAGSGKELSSNSTGAENAASSSLYGYVSSFNSDGITLTKGTDATYGTDLVNTTGSNYVDWLGKAGGAPVANNAGSIASQVSANVTAGFSIVTYTGTGGNATVGHGLGVVPKLVIVKKYSGGSLTNWCVWHQAFTGGTLANQFLNLNTPGAVTSNATVWGSQVPTSTAFGVGTEVSTNQSGETYVANCYAEVPGFSKIGSYTGNGSVDGPFVWCGFRPMWLLVKLASAAGTNWTLIDAARSPYNLSDKLLFADLSSSEGTGGTSNSVDLLSNGFKVRGSAGTLNSSGGSYIFLAIAEAPFNYANAR